MTLRLASCLGLALWATILVGCRTAAPKVTPPAGTYNCPQSVTLAETSPRATIFYTADGSAPTQSSPKYSGAITVDNAEKIQAVALAPGATISKTVSAAYICAPTSILTRGAFAARMQQTFHLPVPDRPKVFPDVPSSDPLYSAVESVAPFMDEQVLCPGCQLNANFFPADPVSRGVSAITMVRILAANNRLQLLSDAESKRALSNVPDSKSLPAFASRYFATAVKSGILALAEGSMLRPNVAHTRAEMSALLDLVQKRFNLPAATPQ